MNERIKEFAFQAMSINQKVSDDSFFVEVSKLNEFEKFAELIVRECIRSVRSVNLEDVDGGDECVINACAENIKKKFGVE